MYAAVLDLKKAFDRVNHFKLFSSLIESGVPIPVINVVRIDVLNYLLLYDGTVPFPIRFQLAVV